MMARGLLRSPRFDLGAASSSLRPPPFLLPAPPPLLSDPPLGLGPAPARQERRQELLQNPGHSEADEDRVRQGRGHADARDGGGGQGRKRAPGKSLWVHGMGPVR